MNNELEKTERSVKKASNFTVLTIGMVLDGKYEIRREIARGGMGIVYEAYHKMLERKVAIKIILSDKISASQFRRFQKEVLACVNLSHPNIIKIYDAGIYNNSPYIVMEYIDGVDICKYVAQHDKNYRRQKGCDTELGIKRDWKLCVQLIYNTALALEYIHKQNMLHRDIKPSNILVRSDGTPIIIDLGLVKFQSENYASLTRTGEVLGTLQYMPIEQAQGKHHGVDARSDIYSLGLVLYELLTGEMAYSGKNPMEICYKIMSYYPPLPREINPQIPEVLEKITMHAIEKKKANRYATAQEFVDELKKYLDDNNAQETKQNADELKKYLYDEHTQPPSKSEDALKKYLYDENAQDTKQDNDDKKQVRLQWNKKLIIACLFELIVAIVLIIAISSMLFSESSGTSKDSQTTIEESTKNEEEPNISPDVPNSSSQQSGETKPPKPEEIKTPKPEETEPKETELDKIYEQYADFKTQCYDILQDEIESKNSELNDYKQFCENLEKEQIDLEIKIKTKQLEINNTKEKYQTQALKDNLNALEKLINETKDQREQIYLNDIKNNIKSCNDIDDIIISLEKELQKKKRKHKRLSREMENIQGYIDISSQQKDKNIINQFEKQKKQKENEMKEVNTDISIIREIIYEVTSIQERLKVQEQKILKVQEEEQSTLTNKLNSVQTDLSLEKENYNSLLKEIEEKEDARRRCKDKMDKFWTNYENCQKNLQKKSLIKKEIQQLEEQLKELKEQIEKLKQFTN